LRAWVDSVGLRRLAKCEVLEALGGVSLQTRLQYGLTSIELVMFYVVIIEQKD